MDGLLCFVLFQVLACLASMWDLSVFL
jgi:hypothetical protein